MTKAQLAGFKAAYTRRIKQLDEQIESGELTVQQAAGYKAAAKRRLNEALAA